MINTDLHEKSANSLDLAEIKNILIETIKGQMKLSASKFEKQIDYKYNKSSAVYNYNKATY